MSPPNAQRIIVTQHAVRRYAERALGRTESLPAKRDDARAIELLQAAGVDTVGIRRHLRAIVNEKALPGCSALIIEGNVRLVLTDGHVTTVTEPKRHNVEPGKTYGRDYKQPSKSRHGRRGRFR